MPCGISRKSDWPEPSALALSAAGLVGLLAYARRKRR
ncbi:MAG: PEP-CTERM sorting domain-containing protein [Pirellulaceae bacterium]|nr:PEP-CTERM sorting domain-containing protein [Pirellulaceae bacterium]